MYKKSAFLEHLWTIILHFINFVLYFKQGCLFHLRNKIAPHHPLLSCFVHRGVLFTACCSPPHFPQSRPSFLSSLPVLRVSVLSLLVICRQADYAFQEANETSNGLNNSTFPLGQLRLPQFICRRYRLVMVSPDAGDIVPWRCGNVGSWRGIGGRMCGKKGP